MIRKEKYLAKQVIIQPKGFLNEFKFKKDTTKIYFLELILQKFFFKCNDLLIKNILF